MMPNGQLPSIGFLGTYPPTSCGLATFGAALRGAIAGERGSEEGLGVVSLVDERSGRPRAGAEYEHLNGSPASLVRTVDVLNSSDVVFVQHEYGIFGQSDGREVLDLLSGLEVPAVVTLHTVLTKPTVNQRSILERVVDLSARTIVMSQTAHERLVSGYSVDPAKVRVIPHGARVSLSGPSLAKGDRPVVLTWGLIGPGKGLELAIDALADLQDLRPLPRYIILGKTHPKVQAAQGDAYRDGLVARAQGLGLEDVVEFDGRYLDLDGLTRAVREADVVVLPYESTEQVTSGVLVEAIAAGKPVIATAFPHAVELLGTGAGIVVPHGDPNAMAAALRTVLTDRNLAAGMAREAVRLGSTLQWPAIARQYHSIATHLAARRRAVPALSAASRRQEVLDGFARVS